MHGKFKRQEPISCFVPVSRSISPNISKKCLYITDQRDTRDKQTIFHSPYKNGKRNPDYSNPTLMSNNLFYPGVDTKDLKVGLVKTVNQQKKEQLHEKRLQTSASALNIKSSSFKIEQSNGRRQRSALRRQQANNHKRLDRSRQLAVELQNLRAYNQLKQSRFEEIKNRQGLTNSSVDFNSIKQYPIYLQNNRLEKEEVYQRNKRQQLKYYLNLADKIKQKQRDLVIKKKYKQEAEVTHSISVFQQKMRKKEKQSKENAVLLSKILQQQIKEKSKIKKYLDHSKRALQNDIVIKM